MRKTQKTVPDRCRPIRGKSSGQKQSTIFLGLLASSGYHVTFFWFLVCYADTQLATQLQQRCIQVVCSNKEARKRLTESNGKPEMDLGPMNIEWTYTFAYYFEVDNHVRRHTNKRGIEQNSHVS